MDTTQRGHRAPNAVPSTTTATTAAERFARWTGAVYAGIAIVGFGLTGFNDPMTTSGHMLGIFEVNPLQNLLRLLVGIALLVAGSAGREPARTLTLLTAAAFGVASLFGLALTGTDANVLALNHPDNLLHLATAVLAAACVAATPRERTPPG